MIIVRRVTRLIMITCDPGGAELVKFSDPPPSGIPSTLLIDRKGRIAARVVGTVSKTALTQMITDIAAEQ
jgi:hypothetical protein